MVVEAEELQAKEFLKRAEIRTMRKDLLLLREVDALKERDKIGKIKTLEEQRAEQEKQLQAKEAVKAAAEKTGREEVLQKNESQERLAEKDLKDYATEQERQQIFLLESQRLGFERQVDIINEEKDPALKLEKNKLLLQKRDRQAKLNSVLEQEKKSENEQKFIAEKAQATTIPSERKGLEARRWDLDKEIQGIEKKRWEAEKQIQDLDNRVSQIDKSSESAAIEKNSLRDKILGADKSLREIYSVIIARVEERRRGEAQEQVAKREALSKLMAEQKEKTQREQWSGATARKQIKDEGYLSKVPKPIRERLIKSTEAEENQRKKFLQNVENWSDDKSKNRPLTQSVILAPPIKSPTSSSADPKGVLPPVPRKNK